MHLLKPADARDRLARRHALRRGRQDPDQGEAPRRVQPAYHRPPAQRCLQPLHRHQDQPPFLHQGRADQDLWYYEHPYPPGYKSYSKTKPIRIEEFAFEKKWWTKRKENEHAWQVPVEQIKSSGYNLDIKNPHDAGAGHDDPAELLADYQKLLAELQQTRDRLKDELRTALERSAI